MNPLKCTFSISYEKLLGFTVHKKGVGLDPTKANTIQDTKLPRPINS